MDNAEKFVSTNEYMYCIIAATGRAHCQRQVVGLWDLKYAGNSHVKIELFLLSFFQLD